MAGKAVFLDRDNTVMEDPGYIGDPKVVKLLPGVELALKSLSQCGYKLVVVTNQSGIARGLLTEQTLDKIHAELRRQLSQRGAHLDAIYYCPFHPEGTIEEYAKESDLRKPQPGMLQLAAKELDIDLSQSWMVGDSARDIEAGQRAGCKTIRVRSRADHHATPGLENDEDVQADYTVRNLVDAARVILRAPRQAPAPAPGRAATPSAQVGQGAVASAKPPMPPLAGRQPLAAPGEAAEAPVAAGAAGAAGAEPAQPAAEELDQHQVRAEILRYVRQIARQEQTEEFSFVKLAAGIAQVFALMGLGMVVVKMLGDNNQEASLWAQITIILQLMSLTLFFAVKRK
jgi:D-glycero-D-manno-heptose 1,7-bisphosphate phosphatase